MSSPSPWLESWRFNSNLMSSRDSRELIRHKLPAHMQHPPCVDPDDSDSDSGDCLIPFLRQRLKHRFRGRNFLCIHSLKRLTSRLPKRKSATRTASSSPSSQQPDTNPRKSILKPAKVSIWSPTPTTSSIDIVTPSSSLTSISSNSPIFTRQYNPQTSIDFWLAMIQTAISAGNEPYLASLTLHLTTASPPAERQSIIDAACHAAPDLVLMVALLTIEQRGLTCLADVCAQLTVHGGGKDGQPLHWKLKRKGPIEHDSSKITLAFLRACEETASGRRAREKVRVAMGAIERHDLLRDGAFWVVLREERGVYDS